MFDCSARKAVLIGSTKSISGRTEIHSPRESAVAVRETTLVRRESLSLLQRSLLAITPLDEKLQNVTARVHLSAGQQGNAWVFCIRDDGIGIEPQYAERIFHVFERLHTREEYPGTGIGLAICKKIGERQAGRSWVESQLAKGSTFYFTITLKGTGL